MALGSTIHVFTIRLADADRAVFETLNLRVARHPSESAEYLVTRVLAYALELAEGIDFSRGLSDPDVPAIAVRDLTGALLTWIDIGTPDAARLHKASKAARRIAVYPHRDIDAWLARLAGERIHRAPEIDICAVDRELVAGLAARLGRRMDFDLSVAEQTLYIGLEDATLSGPVEHRRIEA